MLLFVVGSEQKKSSEEPQNFQSLDSDLSNLTFLFDGFSIVVGFFHVFCWTLDIHESMRFCQSQGKLWRRGGVSQLRNRPPKKAGWSKCWWPVDRWTGLNHLDGVRMFFFVDQICGDFYLPQSKNKHVMLTCFGIFAIFIHIRFFVILLCRVLLFFLSRWVLLILAMPQRFLNLTIRISRVFYRRASIPIICQYNCQILKSHAGWCNANRSQR